MNYGVEVTAEAAMPRASRVDLVERLWTAADMQIRAHEARLKGLAPGEAASEAHAKSLATLARTIKELIEMDAAAIDIDRALQDSGNPHERDPDSALADLASLREELARRLDGLQASHADTLSGEPEPG